MNKKGRPAIFRKLNGQSLRVSAELDKSINFVKLRISDCPNSFLHSRTASPSSGRRRNLARRRIRAICRLRWQLHFRICHRLLSPLAPSGRPPAETNLQNFDSDWIKLRPDLLFDLKRRWIEGRPEFIRKQHISIVVFRILLEVRLTVNTFFKEPNVPDQFSRLTSPTGHISYD